MMMAVGFLSLGSPTVGNVYLPLVLVDTLTEACVCVNDVLASGETLIDYCTPNEPPSRASSRMSSVHTVQYKVPRHVVNG